MQDGSRRRREKGGAPASPMCASRGCLGCARGPRAISRCRPSSCSNEPFTSIIKGPSQNGLQKAQSRGEGCAMVHGGRVRDCAISSTHLHRRGHAREQAAAADQAHACGGAARRARRSTCREGCASTHQSLAVLACVGLLSLARAHGEGNVILGVRGRTGVFVCVCVCG